MNEKVFVAELMLHPVYCALINGIICRIRSEFKSSYANMGGSISPEYTAAIC